MAEVQRRATPPRRVSSAPPGRPPPSKPTGHTSVVPAKQAVQEEPQAHDDEPRVKAIPRLAGSARQVPLLKFPTPSARKVVSARYQTVNAKFMQSSYRSMVGSARPQPSERPNTSGAAANVAAGRNSRIKHRQQPTVDDISRALREKPYLTEQIVAVRDDPTLDKATRMAEIFKIVRECEEPVPISELEELQSKFLPSAERKAGRRAAATAFSAHHKANVAKYEALNELPSPSAVWAQQGGEVVENLLQYVDLVDARYLIALHEHGGNLPCWGALPAGSKISRAQVWRLYGWEARGSLGVLVLSYPWLDYDHPDTHGETLARIVPILRAMLPFCGGEHYTVGVLWDYGSLPQPTRSHAELTRFKLGLRALPMWYAHPHVPVLFVSGELPKDSEHTNRRSFDSRGWCEYERRLAYLCKNRSCLWDIEGLRPAKLDEVEEPRRRFDMLRSQLMTRAEAPLAPSSFALMMQKKVGAGRLSFSEKGDLKLVIEMYGVGFIKAFESYQKCEPSAMLNAYAGHQWEEEQGRQLAAALEYASQKCKLHPASRAVMLNIEGNHFDETVQRLIKQAIKFAKVFSGARL